tara:strand:- start:1014 stop:1244 length:231 start_codon:yes stop_codon:yes gene_type:complete
MSISTALKTYTTVNSSSEITVALNSVSHVIENKNSHDNTPSDQRTSWIHFHSGKSVHVNESFENVSDDMVEFYKTR